MTITINNLERATSQGVFNQVATHLLTQAKRSKRGGGGCLYHHPSGLKCAAGCLISEEEYNPLWEDEDWNVLIEDYGLPRAHDDLIRDLQYLHDNHEVVNWPDSLIDVAREHNLNADVLNHELLINFINALEDVDVFKDKEEAQASHLNL